MNEHPVDLVNVNYGLNENAWTALQQLYKEYLEANPVCEICKCSPSDRITPVGVIKASCYKCIEKLRKNLEESSYY